MQRSASPGAPIPERLLPAWAFSFVFHCTAITLLGMTWQPAPRGAAEEPGRGVGIVLKTSGADGELFEGEEDQVDVPPVAEVDPPPIISPLLPQQLAVTQVAEQAPQPPAPGAGPTAGANQQTPVPVSGGGGPRGSPGGEGYAQVSVFGVQGMGSKFVYLFDRSASMEGPPLAAAKRQLIESLQSLESVHQFHIIFFNTRTQAFDVTGGGRRIAFATDRNKHLAANFVGGITADGGTDRLVALREAIAFAPDVIFFLTDADDPMTPSELADIARANRRAGAAICAIEFGRRPSPSPGNFLAQLASESGGQYGYVDTTRLSQ
jgi:hypothetical protein